jgi:broad specificity phosphatase PhoE
MTKIILIRPGSTEFDQQGRVLGTLDMALCEEGRQQVAAMVAELRGQRIEAIYSSPSQSAIETAEALAAAFDLKVKTRDKLSNVNPGLWQGMQIEEAKTKQPKVYRQWQEQPETVCPPQGETLSAAQERVQAVLAKLLKKHKGDELFAIVAPEPLASVIRHILADEEWGDLWQCAHGVAKWELIQAPETAGVK